MSFTAENAEDAERRDEMEPQMHADERRSDLHLIYLRSSAVDSAFFGFDSNFGDSVFGFRYRAIASNNCT